MTIKDLFAYGQQTISPSENKILIESILKINSLELSLYNNEIVSEQQKKEYYKAIEDIKNGLPIQYVLSSACFYGYDYYVNKNVLIPRFETEELVYETLNYTKKYFPNGKVLDLCTGSGCIGLTMKLEQPNLEMTLSDISENALKVASTNKEKFSLDCQIILSDLFENIHDKYDCIISNPPYISIDEEVMDIVKNNEPSIALYASNNGLAIYERILKEAQNYLNNTSIIAFELNSNKSNLIYDLSVKYFPNSKIIIKKDNYEKDRMLFILNNLE